jgi:hypothetical protein
VYPVFYELITYKPNNITAVDAFSQWCIMNFWWRMQRLQWLFLADVSSGNATAGWINRKSPIGRAGCLRVRATSWPLKNRSDPSLGSAWSRAHTPVLAAMMHWLFINHGRPWRGDNPIINLAFKQRSPHLCRVLTTSSILLQEAIQ